MSTEDNNLGAEYRALESGIDILLKKSPGISVVSVKCDHVEDGHNYGDPSSMIVELHCSKCGVFYRYNKLTNLYTE